MLHSLCHIVFVPRGPSGKIVIDAGITLKQDLYHALSSAKLTLKDWFIREATRFIAETQQPELPLPQPSKIARSKTGRGNNR